MSDEFSLFADGSGDEPPQAGSAKIGRRENGPAAAGQRWICNVCGYIYDPARNDSVAFDDLPANWKCPGCGRGKEVFRPLVG